jgi:chromosome segregation ATPase
MQDIADLERRITVALERIDRGVAGLVAPSLQDAPSAMLPESDFATLNEALDEERALNAQLSERLRVVNDKAQSEKTALLAEISDLNAQLSDQSAELGQLREALASLTEDMDALRGMAEGNVIEPEQINHALQTELAQLQASRAAEAAELASIINALTPLVAEAESHV